MASPSSDPSPFQRLEFPAFFQCSIARMCNAATERIEKKRNEEKMEEEGDEITENFIALLINVFSPLINRRL
jgi:hypothetical protein